MRKLTLAIACTCAALAGKAQLSPGNFSGNMESTFQYLNTDSVIGAYQPDSKALVNSYMNVFYTQGNFKAGVRFESYLPRIQGYPNRFDGTGIGMRYVGYANDFVDVTVGNFYEQFGSGIMFRAYEARALGYDNAMDGLRLILHPLKGITLKGVYGRQRFSFQEGRQVFGQGIVRGADAQFRLNDLIEPLADSKVSVTIGGSLVSKYEPDQSDLYNLPENVAVYGGRLDVRYTEKELGQLGFNGEYAYKINDPSLDNGFIYNSGHALVMNGTYTRKGLGVLVSAKSTDNMSFRSERGRDLQDLLINFLPPTNKTHTYNLVATLYPYATQLSGEVSFQTDILYTIPRGSKLGGKYGTTLNGNFSTTYRPMRHTRGYNVEDPSRIAYQGRIFDLSDSLYWRDINFTITRKFNPKFNAILAYYNISINNNVAKVTNDASGIINAHIGVLELGYKFNRKHALRGEIQGLFTDKDKGDWTTLLLEYTISPHWFFSVMDQYNYGNPKRDLRLHYLIGSFGYIHESTRIMVLYGRQRAGLFCVGGVCRFVPASNGLTISFTQSF